MLNCQPSQFLIKKKKNAHFSTPTVVLCRYWLNGNVGKRVTKIFIGLSDSTEEGEETQAGYPSLKSSMAFLRVLLYSLQGWCCGSSTREEKPAV